MAKGVRVTVTDLETGESESTEIFDDFVLVTAGGHYLAHRNTYPKSGTTVLTVKRDPESASAGASAPETTRAKPPSEDEPSA